MLLPGMYILYPVKYRILGICAQAHVDKWKGDDTEKQRRVTAWKDHTHMFSSYNPAVTQLYSERFPWIGPRNLVLVCLPPIHADDRTDIDDFLTVLPLLQELSKDSIQPRHWTEVMEVPNAPFGDGVVTAKCLAKILIIDYF